MKAVPDVTVIVKKPFAVAIDNPSTEICASLERPCAAEHVTVTKPAPFDTADRTGIDT